MKIFPQTIRARELKLWEKVHLPISVTCQVSHVTCHMSHVTCHMSRVRFFFFFFRTQVLEVGSHICLSEFEQFLNQLSYGGALGTWPPPDTSGNQLRGLFLMSLGSRLLSGIWIDLLIETKSYGWLCTPTFSFCWGLWPLPKAFLFQHRPSLLREKKITMKE